MSDTLAANAASHLRTALSVDQHGTLKDAAQCQKDRRSVLAWSASPRRPTVRSNRRSRPMRQAVAPSITASAKSPLTHDTSIFGRQTTVTNRVYRRSQTT